VKLNYNLTAPDGSPVEIYLKLENLQPINSFKLRGASNAILKILQKQIKIDGVWTASAGNMAAAIAWVARDLKIPCTVVVPEHAPIAKLNALQRINQNVKIIKVTWDEWWKILETHKFEGPQDETFGTFIHPVCNPDVQAGNGTIGLEILEELPDVTSIIVPYGGGGLSTGIASAISALKPSCAVYASEVDASAALSAALAAGKPVPITVKPTFVDGIGGKIVLNEMWPKVKELIKDSLVCNEEEVALAVKLLVENNKVVAEGAGASSVAAAIKHVGKLGNKVVCIISGGGLNTSHLVSILKGEKITKN